MHMTGRTRSLKAAMLMVWAMVIIGVIDSYVVRLAGEIGLWQFHFTRALIALPLVVGLSWVGLGRLAPFRPWAVALRSMLIATAMLLYFGALAFMPIAQALAGLFTSPIFILLISALAMGQRIGPRRVLAVAIGFIGTLFVLQPDPRDFDWLVLLPVLGGLFYALGALATRSICAQESTVALLAGMLLALGLSGAVGLIVLGVFPVDTLPGPDGFITRGWVWPMWQAAPWVAVQAVGSVSGVFLIIRAYQMGEPSLVSVFEYSVMIFGPLFAWILLGQTLTMWQVVGIALIAAAGGIIALRSE